MNEKLTEQLALVGQVSPVSQPAGAVSTGWVSAINFRRFLAVIKTGVLGASATVDAKIEQATSSVGAGAKDVVGKTITQIVKATGDNKQALIGFRTVDLDTNGGFAWVRVTLTVGTAASLVTCDLYGGAARELPASRYNIGSIIQLV